jgi:hypothetical protein
MRSGLDPKNTSTYQQNLAHLEFSIVCANRRRVVIWGENPTLEG